jgi:hypothetical protein
MRECLKCHEPKDEGAFYHPLFHQSNICKECKNADKRKVYAEKQAQREAIRLAEIERWISYVDKKWSER